MFLVQETEPDTFVIIPPDQLYVWVGEGDDAIQYARHHIVTNWSPEERESLGFYLVSPVAVDEFNNKTGDAFSRVEGVVTHTPTSEPKDLGQCKVIYKAKVDAKFYSVMNEGYQHNFGTELEPNYKVLQTRPGEDDTTNWLTLKDTCNDAIIASLGENIYPLGLRTKDNSTVVGLTYNQIAGVLRDMRTWGGYVLAHSWVLKNMIDAAADLTELQSAAALIPTGVVDVPNGLNGWPVHVEA